MRLFAVIGTGRESGKTTTVESLIKEFTNRGYTVGAIKQIHETDFSMDTPEKDTWRMANSGAKVVVGAAPKEISLIKNVEKDRFQESVELLEVYDLDLIIIEGNPLRDVPMILASKDPEKALEILKQKDLICLVSLTPEIFNDKSLDVPRYHPVEDVKALTDYVEKYLKLKK
ncbi:MAG: molybdopterin-guanine dinucleotide biosynthesis protein B [Candidatus Hydrothermarchaeales archaeon]